MLRSHTRFASSAVFWRNFSPFKIIKNFNLQNCLDFSKKLTPTPLATIFVLLSFCQFVLVSYSVTATGGPAIHCLQKFKKIPQNSTFHNIKKLVKFWLLFTQLVRGHDNLTTFLDLGQEFWIWTRIFQNWLMDRLRRLLRGCVTIFIMLRFLTQHTSNNLENLISCVKEIPRSLRSLQWPLKALKGQKS